MARILLGGIFFYAGAVKILDPGKFLIAIRSYDLLGDPFAAWTSLILPWIEVLAGLCVISKVNYRGGLLLLAAMTAMFLVAISSAWLRGLDVDCGCFGGSGFSDSYLEVIVRDLVILGGFAFLALRLRAGTPVAATSP